MVANLRVLIASLTPVIVAVLLFQPAPVGAAEKRRVIGWVERVRVFPGGMEIAAKIDTGARSSSLNAAGLSRFMRDGDEWVAFDVTNRLGKIYRFEKRIVRTVRIRRHRGQHQLRPAVRLGICLGDIYQEAEVNLIDRRGFNYQMLVGRRFLRTRFVVDPARTFTIEPDCKKAIAR